MKWWTTLKRWNCKFHCKKTKYKKRGVGIAGIIIFYDTYRIMDSLPPHHSWLICYILGSAGFERLTSGFFAGHPFSAGGPPVRCTADVVTQGGGGGGGGRGAADLARTHAWNLDPLLLDPLRQMAESSFLIELLHLPHTALALTELIIHFHSWRPLSFPRFLF